ncbi:hypothetical protein [Luteibacter sp. CQ10]|uniref:hypothetical protein n=1 Tax=Luteibacter sp. CQ10 TaxID=2805821 RepID=UPI0034A28B5B
MPSPPHIGHAHGDIAYHLPWAFRVQAMIRLGEVPIAPNLYRVAATLRGWLLRKEHLEILEPPLDDTTGAITNPYAYHAARLALLYASVVNDAYAFANDKPPADTDDVAIEVVLANGHWLNRKPIQHWQERISRRQAIPQPTRFAPKPAVRGRV